MKGRSMKKNRVTYGSVVLVSTIGLCAALVRVRAELPPGAYEELKKNAAEVMTVKILKVKTPEGKKGHFQVLFTAKVLEVTRSKSGVEKGQTLRIASYHVTEQARKEGFVGPRIPSLLPVGWEGRVYLNKNKDKNVYDIAAYGESFEEPSGNMPEK
jgi:hypothetical protein